MHFEILDLSNAIQDLKDGIVKGRALGIYPNIHLYMTSLAAVLVLNSSNQH